MEQRYKLAIIGDYGCGKSSFVEKQLCGKFETIYKPTLGVVITQLTFNTNIGKITFDTWDVSGVEKFKPIRDGYYIQAKCAIIMFDVTNKESYDNVGKWYDELVHVTERIPIVLCGNKIDVKDRIVKPKHITYHRRKNINYFDISAKSNYNIDKPILKLIQQLTNNPDVCFIDEQNSIIQTQTPTPTQGLFSTLEKSPISFNTTNDLLSKPATTTTTSIFGNQPLVFNKESNIPLLSTFTAPPPVVVKNTFSIEYPINLVLLGDIAVGKSTLVQLQLNGTFKETHTPTIGVDVTPITFKTNIGDVTFHVKDISGDKKYLYIRDGYYIGGKCAIIMFDVTNKESYDNVGKWYDELVRVTEKIPIVLCGNKIDVKDRIVKPTHILYHRRKNINYFDISAKSNYNIGKPFLKLIQLLTGDPSVCFVDHNGNQITTTDPFVNNNDQINNLAEPSIIPMEYFDPNSLNDQFASSHFGVN